MPQTTDIDVILSAIPTHQQIAETPPNFFDTKKASLTTLLCADDGCGSEASSSPESPLQQQTKRRFFNFYNHENTESWTSNTKNNNILNSIMLIEKGSCTPLSTPPNSIKRRRQSIRNEESEEISPLKYTPNYLNDKAAFSAIVKPNKLDRAVQKLTDRLEMSRGTTANEFKTQQQQSTLEQEPIMTTKSNKFLLSDTSTKHKTVYLEDKQQHKLVHQEKESMQISSKESTSSQTPSLKLLNKQQQLLANLIKIPLSTTKIKEFELRKPEQQRKARRKKLLKNTNNNNCDVEKKNEVKVEIIESTTTTPDLSKLTNILETNSLPCLQHNSTSEMVINPIIYLQMLKNFANNYSSNKNIILTNDFKYEKKNFENSKSLLPQQQQILIEK